MFATHSEISTKESKSFLQQDDRSEEKSSTINVKGSVEKIKLRGIEIVGEIDLKQDKKSKEPGEKDKPMQKVKTEKVSDTKIEKKEIKQSEKDTLDSVVSKAEQLRGLTVVGKIDIPQYNKKKKPIASFNKNVKKRYKN